MADSPARHRTPVSDIDALAAGHVPPAVARRIHAVERSRRMLMLRAVVEAAQEVRADSGSPLSPLSAALDLLMRVERARPEVVADLLDHPGLGVWAVRMLERLRAYDGSEAGAPSSWKELWTELGYLHALAASAALRAAVAGTIDLPVIGTGVPLPALGQVLFPGLEGSAEVAVLEIASAPAGRATVTAAGQQVVLPADLSERGGGWEPLRGVAAGAGASDRRLVLDTSDPYRDYRDPPQPSPAVLSQEELDHWEFTLRAADEALLRRHPRAAALRATALRVVVPLEAAPRYRPMSASYSEAFGSALMSPLQDPADVAATLVHEGRHSVLNALLHQLPLCQDPLPGVEPALLYAPWRGDPRPLSGLLHGAYSFAGVAEFWRVERHALTGTAADLAHFEFALWREAVSEALDTLASSPEPQLTSLGTRFVAAMAEHTAAWAQEPVPSGPLGLAREEAADLRAVWRARHTRPDAEHIAVLTGEWLRGTDPGTLPAVGSVLLPDPGSGPPDPRGELRRALLDGPGSLLAHARSEVYSASRHPALTLADIALFEGDAVRAVQAYRDVLAERPESPSAWAGLGLAFLASGEQAAAEGLLRRPEVVRAVFLALRRQGEQPDALVLSDWVGRMPMVKGACSRAVG